MALSTQDREEIKQLIVTVVNGKIDRLHNDNREIREMLVDHLDEMEPIAEGWRTVQSGRRFILWVAAPLAAIGTIITFIKIGHWIFPK